MITLKTPDGKLNLREIVPPVIMLLLIVFVAFWPSFDELIVIRGNRMLPLVILAVSWNLFSSPTRYISLASAAFYGLGLYVATFTFEFLPLPVMALFGGAASFVLAYLIGSITLRLRGVYFTIFTFGVLELLRNLINWILMRFTNNIGRFVRTDMSAAQLNLTVYHHLLGVLVILVIVAFIIKRSRYGKALVSIGESEDAAAHVGVNTTLLKVTMFAVSAFFMGAAGAVVAMTRRYVDPTTAFNMDYSFLPILMVIFGGTRNIAGPIIGAIVFTQLQTVLITRYPIVYPISIGLVMILVILFLPGGIIGLGYNIFEKIAAKVKKRIKKEEVADYDDA